VLCATCFGIMRIYAAAGADRVEEGLVEKGVRGAGLGSKSPPLATIPRRESGDRPPFRLRSHPNFPSARSFGARGRGDCYRVLPGIPIWRCSRLPQAVKSRSGAAR
jgi:hypothetical protein